MCLFPLVDGVIAPTTSTQVFYISVSVCCIVIFLVAIFLAIMHLHSMKRMEMEERFVSLVFFQKVLLLMMLLRLRLHSGRWSSLLLLAGADTPCFVLVDDERGGQWIINCGSWKSDLSLLLPVCAAA